MFFSRRAGTKDVDAGELSGTDFDKTDLTIDGNFHDLVLPDKVPLNAKKVELRISYRADVAGVYINLRKKGYASGFNSVYLYTQAVSRTVDTHKKIAPDNNRTITYKVYSTGVTWAEINITVIGWTV